MESFKKEILLMNGCGNLRIYVNQINRQATTAISEYKILWVSSLILNNIAKAKLIKISQTSI